MEGGCEEPTIKIEEDTINGEERGGGDNDEEFYEQIEAPKFVDFTLPDTFRPDDRYWFCSRLGCDRKHEDEMDPEEISKNFVLRVMAARSPNIKLRRALTGKSSGMNMKCPLSAPAKSSKPRISRLAMISSVSHKLVDPKLKIGPPSKLGSTPIAKSKQVAAKYMTTPRRKKSLPTSNSFRSVQNPKPNSILVPKNRLVAKALVFHSPKKGISVKSSVELHTPVTKICEGMKRLEIESQKKRVLGYSSTSSKDNRSISKKPFAKDHSGRRVSFIRGRRVSFLKVKRRSKESSPAQNTKEQEAKPSRGIKAKGKKISTNQCNPMTKQTAGQGSSDMKTDVISRGISGVKEDNGNEEHQPTLGITEESSSADANIIEEPASREKSHSLLSDVSRAEMKSSQNPEKGSEEETDGKANMNTESESNSPRDHSSGYQPSKDSGQEMGLKDNDDKENVLASDVNRDNNCDNQQSGKKVLGSKETLKIKKVARVVDKNLKDGLLPATAVPIAVKYKKPKITNPKPFRLRTDERGILKEANLDRKLHFPAPQNEAAKDPGFSGGNSKRAHGKVSEGRYQKDEPVSRATRQEPKSLTSPLGNGKINVTPKSENSLTRTKSPYPKGQVVTPQGVSSTEKELPSYMRPRHQLGVITETPKRTKPAKENIDGTMLVPKTGSAPSASRSTSRSKRPVTIPKEPNFHSLHVPKSCTRNVA